MRRGLARFILAIWLGYLAAFVQTAQGDEPPATAPAHALPDNTHEGNGAAEAHGEEHHPEFFEEETVQRPLFWVRGEYLLWWTKNSSIPVLLTRGESTDPLPGALDQPNTKILYAGNVSYQDRSGARFFTGVAFDQERTWSFEASYFFLNARRVGIDLASSGNPVLARPFIDAATGTQDSSIVSFPGVSSGGVSITSSSYLYGIEGNLQKLIWDSERWRFDLLAGFRYLGLAESLEIDETSTAGPGAPALALRTVRVADRFNVDNQFYGGQIGLLSEFHVKRVTIGLVSKVAFGTARETMRIRGQTLIDTAVPTNVNAGLYALSSNSGQFGHSAFAVVPEVAVNVGLRVTERLTALVGYSFIYWNRVIRPGDQIDVSLNTNLIPTSNTFGAAGGPARPAFSLRETDYWAQGLNFGVQFRY